MNDLARSGGAATTAPRRLGSPWRRSRAAFACALLFGSVAGPIGVRSAPARPEPALSSVLSAVTLSLKQDGSRDRAVLVANDDGGADLYVYLDLPDGATEQAKMKPTLVKTGVVFAGSMAGQEASLATNAKGSLVLTSMNEAFGRDHWTQKITIAWRKDALAVIGITYQAHDTLDPKGGGTCDLNLLSGKGTRDGKPATGPAAPIPLADWNGDNLPKACQF